MRIIFWMLAAIFLTGCILGPSIFVGLLLGYLTKSVFLGVGAGGLAFLPTYWVWSTAAREKRDLEAYYASNE